MSALSWQGHYAGVDEAGRGPLAGPVVAAAVVLSAPIIGVDDSKKLSALRRAALAETIRREARAWGVGRAEPAEIDKHNIHQATLLAMSRALESLKEALGAAVELIHVDGKFAPAGPWRACTIVGGDRRDMAIAAASILAKTTRDALMVEMDARYPQYGFAGHKGYPTAAHRAALHIHGPCPEHRFSYAPVAQCREVTR